MRLSSIKPYIILNLQLFIDIPSREEQVSRRGCHDTAKGFEDFKRPAHEREGEIKRHQQGNTGADLDNLGPAPGI